MQAYSINAESETNIAYLFIELEERHNNLLHVEPVRVMDFSNNTNESQNNDHLFVLEQSVVSFPYLYLHSAHFIYINKMKKK